MKNFNISLLTASNKLLSSTEVQGLLNLMKDVGAVIAIGGPILCGIAAAVFVARRAMCDEQDSKMWEKRIKTALFGGVAVLLVGGVMYTIGTYFGLDIQV